MSVTSDAVEDHSSRHQAGDVDATPEVNSSGGLSNVPNWSRGFAATFLVIGVSLLTLTVRLLDSYAFMMDDLLQFDVANRAGLSHELLFLNLFQHFAPFNRLVHLALLRLANVNPDVGALFAVALVGVLLTATAWLTFELGMSLFRRLMVLVTSGGALSLIDSSAWNDSALHILAALAATYLVVALHLRGVRTGHWAWHLASVVVFSLGLLTQERAAFALPLVILVDVLLLWRDDPIKLRLRRLWTLRWPLVSMAVIGLVSAYLIRENYAMAERSVPSLSVAARAGFMALTNYQFPQLVGYQPVGQLTSGQQVLAFGIIAVVMGLLIALNKRNTGPILLFLSVFTMYWGFLVLSPIFPEAGIAATAMRLNNAAYVTIPAYISIFSLSPPAGFSRAFHARVSGRSATLAGTAVLAVVTVAVTIAGSAFTPVGFARYRAVHDYWQGMRNSAGEWSDPSKTVLPMQAPFNVAQDWATQYGRTDVLLPMVVRGWTPGDLADSPILLDGQGQVHNAALQRVSGTRPAGAPQPAEPLSAFDSPVCVSVTSPSDGFGFVLNVAAGEGPFLARVNYTADIADQMTAVPLSSGSAPGYVVRPTLAEPGTHEVLLPLPAQSVDSLVINALDAGSNVCFQGIEIVRPVQLDAGGSCWLIDQFGDRTGPQTECPSGRSR